MLTVRNVALTASSASRANKPLPIACIVSVDQDFVATLKSELSSWVQILVRDTYEDLARWTRERDVSAIILDIDTQGEEEHGGIAVLEELRRLNKDLTLISMTRARSRAVEKQSVEAGADAHFRNPVDVPGLRSVLVENIRRRAEEAERERSRQQVIEASRFQDFIGASEPMRLVYDAIQQIAASNINVLIRGESGTGKELAARAIVALSRRANKAFVRLNCAALPENLMNQSSSAANEAHLREPRNPAPDISRWQMAELCSSMRSQRSRYPCKPSSCACLRTIMSSVSAAGLSAKSTFASSALPTNPWRRWFEPANSGRTSTTVST